MWGSPGGAARWGAALGPPQAARLLMVGIPKTPVGVLGTTLALAWRVGSLPKAGCA